MSLTASYEDIAEVQECTQREVNQFLKAGYKLLSVQQFTKHSQFPEQNGGNKFYVKRGTCYVMGRTADVSPVVREDRP